MDASAPPNASQVTALFTQWSAGDTEARDQLIPLVYGRLRELAQHRLRSAPGKRSLNTTRRVHEAYLELVHGSALDSPDRAHLLALGSQVMRNLVVDRAGARAAAKRGGGRKRVELHADLMLSDESYDVVMELDAALTKLEAVSPRQAGILTQSYFGGLSMEETSAALGVSLTTVKRELRSARAWLALQLRGAGIR